MCRWFWRIFGLSTKCRWSVGLLRYHFMGYWLCQARSTWCLCPCAPICLLDSWNDRNRISCRNRVLPRVKMLLRRWRVSTFRSSPKQFDYQSPISKILIFLTSDGPMLISSRQTTWALKTAERETLRSAMPTSEHQQFWPRQTTHRVMIETPTVVTASSQLLLVNFSPLFLCSPFLFQETLCH